MDLRLDASLVNQIAPQLLAERGTGVLLAAKVIGEIAGIDASRPTRSSRV